MILWLKARRVHVLVAPATLAFIVVVAVGYDQYVQLPSLLGSGGNRVFLVQLAPVVITSALAQSLAHRVPEIEKTARRNTRLLDSALITTTVAVAAMAVWALGDASRSQEVLMAARNVVFLTGLMVLTRVLHEQAAVMAPVTWVFAVIFLGHRDPYRPWPWAVTLHPPGSLPTLALCLAVFGAGITAHVRHR
ncbi:hypothetical protein [Streptomyces sp. CC219B]|uniref:hypothetical protein n=1 Tax=Streptomyces sp. CC219B TaxID=3044574 RepID=UPI0024A987FF|nr:hypothetical protein [Streptomyces sp. CC219B]